VTLRATFASLIFLVALCASAKADSIVYVRTSDASLWTVRSDGTHARKISDGHLEWPSESNNGIIVARGPGRRAPDGMYG